MTEKLQSVRGMNDLLPGDSGAWQRVEAVLREVARAYGYREIRTPIVEKTELFTASIGGGTDIVEKEMYSFTDRGGDNLTLRPEATASTVRACNQHGLLHNACRRLWYLGPMFRRERPQRGRYRQFHQFGMEAFGWPGPDIDAELILAGARIWRRLGLRGVTLQVNTLGTPAAAAAYREALREYFGAHEAGLDADSRRRLTTNPLRILDSKHPDTIDLAAAAPLITPYLEASSRAHFDGMCAALTAAGVEFTHNPRLVRGLDYYTGGVFEWLSGELGAQNAVCAGGRYDDLVAQRGGSAAPAVGFALGLERLVELTAAANDTTADTTDTDIYIAADEQTDPAPAVAIAERLRGAGYAVISHCGGGRLKTQLKRADQSGARVAVISDGGDTAQVKRLRHPGGQQPVQIGALVDWCEHNLQPHA